MKSFLKIYIFLSVCFSYAQGGFRNFITKTSLTEKEGIALVLANDDYQYIKGLNFCVNDAKNIINPLKKNDVDIVVGYNLNKKQMYDAISDFSKRLKDYKYAIVYYSGHGVQKKGENFIIPIDAKGTKEWQFDATTININEIFKEFKDFNKPKLLILDACRDNPFEEFKSMVKGKGLALIEALDNSLVLFSTSPDTAVKDSNQFTEILSQEISEGGCIAKIIKDTRITVKKKYPNQSVYAQDNLTGDICFGDKFNINSIDSDGDGVVDDVDKCPNEYGPIVNNGCPKTYNFVINKNFTIDELNKFLKAPENIRLLEKEAQSENQFALYNLGYAYLKSVGDYEFNFKKAVDYFERAAEFGNSWAENNLGYIYECGVGSTGSSYYGDEVSTEDEELAFEWFKRAAAKNNPVAYYNLAIMYHKGYGTKKSFDEAKKWYIKAGHTGNSEAHYILGKHYYDNEDWKTAAYWLEQSLAKDDFFHYPRVNYMLGEIYFFGKGKKKNYKLAYRYISKANELDYKSSYYLMGAFYENGYDVVKTNANKAREYFKKGCDKYDSRACKRIGRFSSRSSISSSWTSCNTESN